ncbi:MAG: permease [Polyangiaceae bacterium]
MIAGHFGFAAAVKSKAPNVPLWLLMVACQWLDIVFVPLVAFGVEGLEPISGVKSPGYGEVIIHADYTHSLVGAALLSLLFGAVAAWRYGRRSGVILGLVSMSHWLLDLFMHRADMPLLPGNAGDFPRLGFGLWRSPAAAGGLELAFVVVGAVLYWRAARQVAETDGAQIKRANLCGALALGFGVLTLALDLAGL